MGKRLKITWVEGPGYPLLIKGCAAGVVDGRLYVAGGCSWPKRMLEYGFWLQTDEAPPEPPPNMPPVGERLDHPSGLWHLVPPMPKGMGWTNGCAVAGGLAVVGGRNADMKSLSDVFFLDVENGAGWRRLPDLPNPAIAPSVFADGDVLYTGFGATWADWGDTRSNGDSSIYRLNVRTGDHWEIASKFPEIPRFGAALAKCRDHLYAVGGYNYITVERPDFPRNPHSAYTINAPRKVGDREMQVGVEWYGDAWRLDIASGEWERLPYPPRTFATIPFVVDDRWIVFAGGRNFIVHPEGSATQAVQIVTACRFGMLTDSPEVWALDTEDGRWQMLDPLPYGICSNAVAPWRDKVYLVGNETGDEPRSNTFNTVFEGHIEVEEAR